MPLYEFENTEHGIRIDLPLPVDARPDTIVLVRRTVPSRVTVGVGARPATQGEALLQSYKAMESQGKLTQSSNYLSVAEVKRAASMPDI
jgi:hypothetical protein